MAEKKADEKKAEGSTDTKPAVKPSEPAEDITSVTGLEAKPEPKKDAKAPTATTLPPIPTPEPAPEKK